MQAVQMLDMAVYNNVFIGEHNAPGKKGSGVTTDFATPLRYLQVEPPLYTCSVWQRVWLSRR